MSRQSRGKEGAIRAIRNLRFVIVSIGQSAKEASYLSRGSVMQEEEVVEIRGSLLVVANAVLVIITAYSAPSSHSFVIVDVDSDILSTVLSLRRHKVVVRRVVRSTADPRRRWMLAVAAVGQPPVVGPVGRRVRRVAGPRRRQRRRMHHSAAPATAHRGGGVAGPVAVHPRQRIRAWVGCAVRLH